MIIAATVGILLGMSGGFMVDQFGIAKPMRGLVRLLQRLAKGEDIEITGTERKDEIGETARAVNGIKVMLGEKARQEAEAKTEQDRIAAAQRKRDMHKLADEFEGAVGEIIQTVSSAATEMEASANSLTTTAERTQELSTAVAAAAEEASANGQSVASASEELTTSVNEISRQVQASARVATEAVDQSRKTNDRVGELSKAASLIGDVVELINSIAGQTNLLALNDH
jgi:methyl-accepting chemotaxis protein